MQIISNWFLKHYIDFTILKWSPQSPDLNPIESGMGEWCATSKSTETQWCHHANMDQNLRGMFPAHC